MSWVVTIHKLQDCKLEKVVIDLGRSLFAERVAVVLSKVKSLDGLFITSMDHNRLLSHLHG